VCRVARKGIGMHQAHGVAAFALLLALGCAGAEQPDGSGAGSAAGSGAGTGFGNAGSSATAGVGAAGTGATAGTGGAGGASSMWSAEVRSILVSACFKNSVQSNLLPANILFVVDRSGSMRCNPPPTTDSVSCEAMPQRADPSLPSKWEITSRALSEALRSLPATATIGVAYFSNNDSCGVSAQPSVPFARNTAAQQATIEASLGAVTPGGGTPIVGATVLAYKHMHESALAGKITGNEFVVLITDGQQSEQCGEPGFCTGAQECTDYLIDEQVVRAASEGVGIRTFAVGVPGSEPARVVLSELAVNGGTAADGCDAAQGDCHFDMTTTDDLAKSLSEALAKIAGRAVACELPLPKPESGTLDVDAVNVVYTPGSGAADAKIIARDTRLPCDAGADGWQYTEDNAKIRLCGASCDSVRDDMGARVDVVLGCPAVE
jgi:Mg-chelatase subunit ChlD